MSSRAGERIQTIDGMRGVAALLVVLFHLHGAISRYASGWLWAPLDLVVRNGFLGVDMFFVISGFVIALSVSKGAPTFSYLGRFILRRSIRLDPPYWSAILLEVLLLFLTLRYFSGFAVTMPTVPQLGAHLFYAQEILGYGSVVNVFWTLCYEIQFYAFYVGMVVLLHQVPENLRTPRLIGLLAALAFGLSLWTRYWRPEWLPQGLAIDRWFQFFIGVLTWRAVSARGRMTPLVAAWAALAVAVLVAGASGSQFLAIGMSALLVVASRDTRWGRIFETRPLIFLGAISYSLYLYHSSVGWRFVSVVQRMVPGTWSPLMAIGVYLVGVLGSIGFAAALWWCIERPCLKLCQRIRLPRRTEVAPAGAAEAPVVAAVAS